MIAGGCHECGWGKVLGCWRCRGKPAPRRFGLIRWFQPETLVGRVRQETAMRAGELRRLPTCFGALDTKAGEL